MTLPIVNGKAWIPILITILVQTMGIVWWASGLSAKVTELTAEVERQRIVTRENAENINKVETIQQQLVKIFKPYEQPPPPLEKR